VDLEEAPLLHPYSSSTLNGETADFSKALVPLTELHSITSYKTVMLTFTGVKTCNLMSFNHVDKNIKETI
jgi:hypothetical protein